MCVVGGPWHDNIWETLLLETHESNCWSCLKTPLYSVTLPEHKSRCGRHKQGSSFSEWRTCEAGCDRQRGRVSVCLLVTSDVLAHHNRAGSCFAVRRQECAHSLTTGSIHHHCGVWEDCSCQLEPICDHLLKLISNWSTHYSQQRNVVKVIERWVYSELQHLNLKSNEKQQTINLTNNNIS